MNKSDLAVIFYHAQEISQTMAFADDGDENNAELRNLIDVELPRFYNAVAKYVRAAGLSDKQYKEIVAEQRKQGNL